MTDNKKDEITLEETSASNETSSSQEDSDSEATQQKDNFDRKIACTFNPIFEKIINGTAIFETKEEAENEVERLKGIYAFSKKLSKNGQEILWIRGYEISAEEEKEGYFGHFAEIHLGEKADGKFILEARKKNIELNSHPQRKRVIRRNPDWGHPALRSIKKGKLFNSKDEILAVFQQIATEYPETASIKDESLSCLVYSKKEKPFIKKYIFNISDALTIKNDDNLDNNNQKEQSETPQNNEDCCKYKINYRYIPQAEKAEKETGKYNKNKAKNNRQKQSNNKDTLKSSSKKQISASNNMVLESRPFENLLLKVKNNNN